MLVVHGAGAHASALWPVAALLGGRGIDLAAVDLPLYGRTETASRHAVTYEDWVGMLVDLIAAEDDGRPLILFGASIGGLLAVEAAARSGRVASVVATCLLDPRTRDARAVMTRMGPLAPLLMPMLRLVRGPIARVPIKVAWVADLGRMGRDPGLGRLCARDCRGGGAWVPLGFVASYLQHPHAEARASRVPVHLMHPELDDWTPMALSEDTLRGMRSPSTTRLLRGCGHFPLEEPGLQELVDGVEAVAAEAAAAYPHEF
ncbi:alpha/beta hydrolase [Microbacterium lushaniae]|nr:alpha/beta hydrolase [Microbacterium lushaniae]